MIEVCLQNGIVKHSISCNVTEYNELVKLIFDIINAEYEVDENGSLSLTYIKLSNSVNLQSIILFESSSHKNSDLYYKHFARNPKLRAILEKEVRSILSKVT